MTAILFHPEICIAGAASGLLVWFESVLPSLFPFMVLTGLLIKLNIPTLLSDSLKKRKWLRHFPVSFLFAAIIGLLCGYPMGIRTVSELRESKQLSNRQSALLISFVNQPGPMFILGYALPMCRLTVHSSSLFIVAFYGSVLLTALIFGCLQLISGRNISFDKSSTIQPTNATHQNGASFFRLFEDSILSSMITLTKIGGYMMLFSLIFALIRSLLPARPEIILLLSGIMEMTSGIAGVSAVQTGYTPYLILGFISFGGLCVTAQSFSLGKLEIKEQLYYLLAKSIQTILAILLFYLIKSYFNR